MLARILVLAVLAVFVPLETLAKPHGPARMEKRSVAFKHQARAAAQQKRPKRSLNDAAAAGGGFHVPLKRAPASDAHPRARFLANQAHALVRHARANNVEVDFAALRKRGMPIGMGGHLKPMGGGKAAGNAAGGSSGNRNTNNAVSAKSGSGSAPSKSSTTSLQPAAGAALAANVSTDAVAGESFDGAVAKAALTNSVTQPEAPTAANSIGLAIEGADVGYFGTVSLGTPAKQFNILLDSGSADTWVPSQSCRTCGSHTALGSSSSSTFKASNKQFAVTYGTGEVEGVIIQDTLSVAGLTLTGHTFGVSTDESDDFSSASTPFDGLMGLALSSLSEQKVPTPIESMKTAGIVSAAQMGYALGSVGEANDGQATFGGVDATKFSGSLTLVDNVSKAGFWSAAVSAVTVNGQQVGKSNVNRQAILDTGTTVIVAPAADAQAVHAAIPGAKSDGQGGFIIPCTTNATVALTVGGKSFSMTPQQLAFLPVDLNDLNGGCSSAIIDAQGSWLVGAAFLRGVYLATDVDNNQIGLAPLV